MERLQKVMAHAGIDSRRKCEKIILEGRVKVNGELVTELGTKVSTKDLIELDGVPIYREEPKYIMLYKPTQVLSAVSDPTDRKVVVDYILGVEERIYPIGRLDYDTSGLLLLTNDGDFANAMMHPRYNINKEYIAKVDGIVSQQEIKKLENGIILDGKKTSKAKAKVISSNQNNQTSVVSLTIREGWNHQVKRMFEAIGHPVKKLKRERFSFLDLANMIPGEWRELTAFEVDKLFKQSQA